jgi:hypothetical protein
MDLCDVLMLVLGVSLSVHAGTACAFLSVRAGRKGAEALLTASGAVAGAFSLWLAVIGLYR